MPQERRFFMVSELKFERAQNIALSSEMSSKVVATMRNREKLKKEKKVHSINLEMVNTNFIPERSYDNRMHLKLRN
ncbi:hypothetical protein LAZ67_6002635 [Cordylochernes scorpioides]|uniref:Uncharacterized protein n=1 Tax=Cordylochernes scorpioides TaxID=51811 RepID=A0ABY6KKD7_9ARAC|nr:hypothetical protein LAZ67_6002635 [Cordylochernes scorpioides]